MTIKDFFSFSKNRFFWLNIVGMILFVIAAIFATLKGLDAYTQHGRSISVPSIRGMQVSEALSLLQAQNLDLVVTDSSYISEFPPGAIMEQNPIAGSRVKQDRPIFVTVNSGSIPRKTLPDIIDNCSLREARAKIVAAGFNLGENERIQGENDWVYGVKYNGRELTTGEQVPIGATLILVVGDDKFFMEEANLDSINAAVEQKAAEAGTSEIDDTWF